MWCPPRMAPARERTRARIPLLLPTGRRTATASPMHSHSMRRAKTEPYWTPAQTPRPTGTSTRRATPCRPPSTKASTWTPCPSMPPRRRAMQSSSTRMQATARPGAFISAPHRQSSATASTTTVTGRSTRNSLASASPASRGAGSVRPKESTSADRTACPLSATPHRACPARRSATASTTTATATSTMVSMARPNSAASVPAHTVSPPAMAVAWPFATPSRGRWPKCATVSTTTAMVLSTTTSSTPAASVARYPSRSATKPTTTATGRSTKAGFAAPSTPAFLPTQPRPQPTPQQMRCSTPAPSTRSSPTPQ